MIVARNDRHSALERLDVAEQTGDTTQLLHRRRVRGVESHPNAGLLGDGQNFAKELLVVLPQLVLGVLGLQFGDGLVRIVDRVDVEGATASTAAQTGAP